VTLRKALGCILLVAAPIVSALGPASAGKDCVNWSVTAPVLGTRSGQRCSAELPPFFSQPFTDQQCGGVPPANTTFCVTLTIYTP
jgi:hypothetical protein